MWRRFLWVVIIAFVFILPKPMTSPVLAQTIGPTPMVVELQETASLPWYVGALLFVGVGVGLTTYKLRHQANRKKPVITTNCCAPLVEDGTRPFQPGDDLPEQKP